jgi:ornithine cyclodeaminase/alanine dehydrogenase-like protein (mu-crystallin family)
MSLLVLTADDVAKVTANLDHEELTSLMAQVFIDLSANRGIVAPHRISVPTAGHSALFMPSRLGDCTAMKVVSVPTFAEDKRGLAASTIVLDEDTGAVKAIVNAGSLTALRTAAGEPGAASHASTFSECNERISAGDKAQVRTDEPGSVPDLRVRSRKAD